MRLGKLTACAGLVYATLQLGAQTWTPGSTAGDPNCTGGLRWTVSGGAIQTLRYTDPNAAVHEFTCTFQAALAAPAYSVTLEFVEPTVTAAGLRTFDVYVNSVPFLADFDVWAAGGVSVAAIVTRQVQVVSPNLAIRVVAKIRNGILSRVTLAPIGYRVASDTTLVPQPDGSFKLPAGAPVPASWMQVFRNGIEQTAGGGPNGELPDYSWDPVGLRVVPNPNLPPWTGNRDWVRMTYAW